MNKDKIPAPQGFCYQSFAHGLRQFYLLITYSTAHLEDI